MNKKTIVGVSAVISTIISVLLWFWYASLPSFQDSEKSFKDLQEQTFQTSKENLK